MADKPIYIRNAKGGVHSVTEEHYKALLEEDGTLPKNWAKLSESEAKKTNPALFGLDENGQPVQATAEPTTATSRDEAAELLRELVAQLKAANSPKADK